MTMSREAFLGHPQHDREAEWEAHDAALSLGRIGVEVAGVERAPRYPGARRENNAEHSFHLALTATELAATYFPELDPGLIAQFSLVHDFSEIYAGDARTFAITPEELVQKAIAEKEATKRVIARLPPHTAQLLERYEEQKEPEARFVRFVDKLLPSIINIVGEEGRTTLSEDFDVHTVEELRAGRSERLARLQGMFPDFPFLHAVEELISESAERIIFSGDMVAFVTAAALK